MSLCSLPKVDRNRFYGYELEGYTSEERFQNVAYWQKFFYVHFESSCDLKGIKGHGRISRVEE